MANEPPSPEDLIAALGSGGSSGGSSGSTRKKKTSYPYTNTEQLRASKVSSFVSIYVGLWGEYPDPDYINKRVKSGWSLAEFEANERSKPAFKYSPAFQEATTNVHSSIAQKLGALG